VRCALARFAGWLGLHAAAGCAPVAQYDGWAGGNPPAAPVVENPLFIPAVDRELLWNQLVDTTDDHFRIEHEQRIQQIGNELTEGRIDTFPTVGSTMLEPWRRDSTPGYEKLHATLQTTRRRAELRATPTAGGYLVHVMVVKELEDLQRPEHATAGRATPRHDGTLVDRPMSRHFGPPTLGWIPLGRDTSLEQRMLAEVRDRLSECGALPAVSTTPP